MWGRMASCGRVVLGLVGICTLVGRPSATRPQVANLPHNGILRHSINTRATCPHGGESAGRDKTLVTKIP
jgi:hypothetical protein